MLFTIGYQKTSLPDLTRLLDALGHDSMLIDVRSSPRSKKAEFSQGNLANTFGARYAFAGEHLGGRKPVTKAGLLRLKKLSDEHNVIIMCMEHAPGDCHRHHAICAPHFEDALHIFEDMLIQASDLSEAMQSKSDDIAISGSTDDILAGAYLLA